MRFTGEWLDSLASALRGQANTPKRGAKGAEARQHLRVGVRILTSALLVRNGKAGGLLTIHIRDISPQGLGLTTDQDLIDKQRFIIELPLEAGGKRRILCEVKNRRRLGPNLFGYGATFLSSANLDRNGGQPSRPAPLPTHVAAEPQRVSA